MRALIQARTCLLLVLGMAAASESASAATITQAAVANYRLTQSAACGTYTCTTTLDPPTVVNLGAGTANGTANLRAAFDAEYNNITYAYSNALDNTLNWNVTTYQAFNTGANSGANFGVTINTPNPLPAAANGGTYHWVQWVTDNWNITGYNPGPGAPQGIGKPESTIDGTAEKGSPFYDVAFGWPMPTLGDRPTRGEPTQAVPVLSWDAWLFLVLSQNDPINASKVQVTFYNGIEWGWQATITPLPATLPLFASALGIGGLIMRRRKARAAAAA
jgi:hypothetical protein